MSSMIAKFDDAQRLAVCRELADVYTSQRRFLSAEMRDKTVYRLSQGEFDFETVIRALRRIREQKKVVKTYDDIRDCVAAEQKVVDIPQEPVGFCSQCNNSGIVSVESMDDDLPGSCVIGCVCMVGQRWARAVRTVVWGGGREQMIRGRKYRVINYREGKVAV